MPARKSPSRARQAFCASVNELGRQRYGDEWREVESTDVERWTAWDLVPPVDRPGRGRGAGREPQYTEEHAEAVVESAALVRRYRSIPLAVAILFQRGRSIPPETLRKAYGELLGRFEKLVAGLAEDQRKRLQVPAGTPTELAEMAEAGMAQRLASNPETAALRALFRTAGFGVENTLEVMSALLLQIVTIGKTSPSDLEVLSKRLNIPSGGESSLETGWLPTDDQVRKKVHFPELREIINTATQEDFKYARDAVIRMNRIIDSERQRTLLAAYGLSNVVEMVRTGSEDSQALALLLPLMFRVEFQLDIIAVAELLLSDPPESAPAPNRV